MRLLVLGGTKFVGRAVVEAALGRGDDVTLFNRGRTNPELFPEVEKLHGDRDGGLEPLRGRSWDSAIDPSGYVPRVVRASAELLHGSVGHYVFVSSISAYGDFSRPVVEDGPKAAPEYESEDVPKTYGALKSACEDVVAEVFGDAGTSIRAGLVVGRYDPTARFTYWVRRVARGGDVLAPEPRRAQVQWIDVRDLAEWMLDVAAHGIGGVFNATGPAEPVSMEGLLEGLRGATASDARLVWVGADFLRERGVTEWETLPLWIEDPSMRGVLQADVSRAVASGLTFRDLAETARDVLELAPERVGGVVSGFDLPQPGLTPERERALLDEWAARA